MPATVKNISKQPVTVILDHPDFHNTRSGWRRTSAQFAQSSPEVGMVVQEVRRAIPGSLLLMPGQSIAGLPASINLCQQVPQLVHSKVLTVTITQEATS